MRLLSTSLESSQLDVTIISHNIRFATTTPSKGERLWSDRAHMLINNLHLHTVGRPLSILCLQEALQSQLLDIESGLRKRDGSDDWTHFGVGRDDGRTAGEYCPIFYRASALKLLHAETNWLSSTPDRPSKYPGAGSIRLMTCAVFQPETDSTKRLIVINTHLDDQAAAARVAGAQAILSKAAELASRFGEASLMLFCSDLSSQPNEEAYQIVVSEASPFKDCLTLSSPSQRYGFSESFTGFGVDSETHLRIDFVFLSMTAAGPKLNRLAHGILGNQFEGGLFISDHRAIFVNLLMEFK